MYNKAIIMGRITKDVELKQTPAGVSVTSFTVAVDRRFTDKDGERQTDFINCVAWRQQAEFICKYFGKGRMIHVEGELQNRQWKDKDGRTNYTTEIIVDRADFTGEPKAGDMPPKQEVKQEVLGEQPTQQPAGDEDYPF